MSERYTHQTWGAGYIVSPDPNTYRPARFSRWRLLMAALGLKKLPELYVVCDLQAAIERTRVAMDERLDRGLWDARRYRFTPPD